MSYNPQILESAARRVVILDVEPIDEMIRAMEWERKFRRIQKMRQKRGITSYYDAFGMEGRRSQHENTR